MEPGNQEQTQAWAPPPGMQWGGPPAAPETPRPSRPVGGALPPEGRPGLVVLAAVLTQLVLIGALANQGISGKIEDDITSGSFWHLLERSWLTYRWRVTPHSGMNGAWGGELALIATTVVLTALLVFVLARGAVTFWRAFFGTWLAVLGASVVGAVVRGLIDTDTYRGLNSSGSGRFTIAVFGPLGPGQFVVVAAFLLGLVTALVAGTVATATRHPAYPAAAAPAATPTYAPVPEPPPPYYGESAVPAQPPWQDQRFEPHGGQPGAGYPTTVLRPVGDDAPTTQYAPPPPPAAPAAAPPAQPSGAPSGPPWGPPAASPPASAAPPSAPAPSAPQSGPPSAPPSTPPPAPPSSGEPTTQFPRPPDDEDLH